MIEPSREKRLATALIQIPRGRAVRSHIVILATGCVWEALPAGGQVDWPGRRWRWSLLTVSWWQGDCRCVRHIHRARRVASFHVMTPCPPCRSFRDHTDIHRTQPACAHAATIEAGARHAHEECCNGDDIIHRVIRLDIIAEAALVVSVRTILV